MNENDKKNATTVQGQVASLPKSSTQSITPNKPINQAKSRFKKDNTKTLNANAKVSTLAVKCYDEQLPNGEQYLIDAIHATSSSDFQIMAIRHDRDLQTDGIWSVAKTKAHWHIIVRCTDSKKRIRVLTILDGLGICFRKDLDDGLWLGHGVETIGNFAGYALYLTHETKEAINDAKELYDRSSVISNMSLEEQDQIRDGYIRISEKRKITSDELVALDKEAYDLGFALKDFDDWYDSLTFSTRSHAKIKVIKESYQRGLNKAFDEVKEIDRCCIFIRGDANTGKSYTSEHILKDELHLKTLLVRGGGTGKFDNLKASHEAMLIDDDTCPNLLNIADSKICRAYKRNSDNKPWAGKFLVVTSNLSFDEWLESCGLHVWLQQTSSMYGGCILNEHGNAMHSRFFICEMQLNLDGSNRLALIEANPRGCDTRKQRLLDIFLDFQKRFNTSVANYRPSVSAFSQTIEKFIDR